MSEYFCAAKENNDLAAIFAEYQAEMERMERLNEEKERLEEELARALKEADRKTSDEDIMETDQTEADEKRLELYNAKKKKEEMVEELRSKLELHKTNIKWVTRNDVANLKYDHSGSQSAYYKAKDKLGSVEEVFIRIFQTTDVERIKEILLLASLKETHGTHPNIVDIYGPFMLEDPVFHIKQYGYVMEYVNGANLKSIINTSDAFHENKIYKLISNAADGILWLCKNEVPYRNICPENILLTSEQELKLSGFGVCKRYTGKLEPQADTMYFYLPPEVLDGTGDVNNPATDVYALAIIMWELFYRKPPYMEEGTIELCENIVQKGVRPRLGSEIPRITRQYMEQCWTQLPENRPTILQWLTHFKRAILQTVPPFLEDATSVEERGGLTVPTRIEEGGWPSTSSHMQQYIPESTVSETPALMSALVNKPGSSGIGTKILSSALALGGKFRQVFLSSRKALQGHSSVQFDKGLSTSEAKPTIREEGGAFFLSSTRHDVDECPMPKFCSSELTFATDEKPKPGSFKTVRKVFTPLIGPMALKTWHKLGLLLDEPRTKWRREIAMIYHLGRHPNIVELYGLFYQEGTDPIPSGILMEFMEGGDLYQYITNHAGDPIPLEFKNTWAIQIAEGLRFIHSKSMMHRNLRPNKIMLSQKCLVAKIADLGTYLVEVCGNSTAHPNPIYAAPEIYMDPYRYTRSADVWSYALILYFIYYERNPYDPKVLETISPLHRVRVWRGLEIHSMMPQRPILAELDIDHIIQKCWQTEPSERSTMTEMVDFFHSEIGSKMFTTVEENADAGITETPFYTVQDFTNLTLIKQGAYSKIYAGMLRDYGESAYKEFIWLGEQHFDKYKREIEILMRLRHPNIVQLYGIVWDGIDKYRFLGYVMEYIEGGSLHDVIYNHAKSYDFHQICLGIEQIARGLMFLHNNGIIHRDVKPENILVAVNQLKLADFGIAKNLDASTTAGAGTLRYMGPEVLETGKCSPSSDIYSLAIIIWEMFHRKAPYFDRREPTVLALLNKIIKGTRPRIDSEKMNPDITALVKRCWHTNAENRPEIKEVVDYFETHGTLHNQLARPLAAPLLYGHLSSPKEPSTILVLGGFNSEHSRFNMAVLNSSRSKWITLYVEPVPPQWPREECAVYLNEEIYLFGCSPRTFFKLDKISLKWIRLADMNMARSRIVNSCLAWDGYIWVFGGNGGKNIGSLKSVERYDPRENTWTMMPDMKYVREGAAATVWNDRIIIAGGLDNTFERSTHRRTNTVESFDPRNGSWTELPRMPSPLNGHSLVAYKDRIIVIGGDYWLDGLFNVVWELEPDGKNPKWTPLTPKKYNTRKFATTVFESEIYAIGGLQGMGDSGLKQVEIFDGNKWRKGPSLPCEWYKMSAAIVPQSFADFLSRECKVEDIIDY